MSRWVEITLRHAGFIVQQLTGFFRYATLPLSSGICVTQRCFFVSQAGSDRCLNVTLRRVFFVTPQPIFFVTP